MSTAALESPLAHARRLTGSHAFVLAVFTATLFVSAFLLFSVQPVFAKLVLPKLGGSPSVWAVSLCFFQAALLAGYSYAYGLIRYAGPARGLFIHLAVLFGAALALPFGLPDGTSPDGGDTYLWLIGVLAAGVGLPFFAVSANAPLLQAWYAATGHPHGRDPYFLYGASNLGSLLALVAYPIVFEPTLGLATQVGAWTTGFVVLAGLIAVSGLLMLRERQSAAAGRAAAANLAGGDDCPVSLRDRLGWVFYAFVPSGLLVAFTTFITTDVASAPFLWVTPLAAFLLTFVLVFRDEPRISPKLLLAVQPFLAAAALASMAALSLNGWLVLTLVHAPLFMVTMLVAHKRLYDARPDSRHLTQFYLWMSLGGVLGGVFAAIVAPQLFNGIHEYMLLIVLGLLARPGMTAALADRAGLWRAARVAAAAAAAIAALTLVTVLVPGSWTNVAVFPVVVLLALFLIGERNRPALLLVHAAALVLAVSLLPSSLNSGYSERSFFGVTRVSASADGTLRLLMHGTTVHGAQQVSDLAQATGAPRPLTYYYFGSPMSLGAEVARTVSGKPAGGLVAGVVGLGAGSLACSAKADESWRFYEIDPVVVRVASDPTRFTFLSRCTPNPDIVLGDARLTLAREPAGKFDYLVIDAFSSDSVPVHMMTREAIALFLDKTTANGLVAMHVSNRYMSLDDVVAATALTLPGVRVVRALGLPEKPSMVALRNIVVYLSRSDAAIAEVAKLPNTVEVTSAGGVAPWTDDYSNIVAAIWRGRRQL